MLLKRSIIIGIVVGEASGDYLGAGLMRALQKHLNIQFFGVAGPLMELEGINIWYKIEELSVVGLVEILFYLPRLWRIYRDLVRRFLKLKPDIFIGIDFPDFTIPLEKYLKKHGILTVHYVSPSIWAWRKNRIFQVNQATDNLLVLLPFEKLLYGKLDISCRFIGHPLADDIPMFPDKYEARRKLCISSSSKCLALLPGSRMNEIKMLSNIFLQCAELLSYIIPNFRVLVALNNDTLINQFLLYNSKLKNLTIFKNKSHQVMIASDAALLASGTVTLECMLAKCPMVVCYRMHPITFIIAKYLVKTKWISLPNILAKSELIKEYIQDSCVPETLVRALVPLFNDHDELVLNLQYNFRKLHQQIRCNANEQAARVIIKLINR